MFPLRLSIMLPYVRGVSQAKNSSLDTYCIYRLSFPPSLKAQKRGGVYTIREPTPHLGAPAATQFVLPHSVPIVAVWYLRFPSTASSQRLMCGLLRLHSRHYKASCEYVRDTHPATSTEELYQRPTILNSHHIHSIAYSAA